jgi:biotin carboxyl carrier protein
MARPAAVRVCVHVVGVRAYRGALMSTIPSRHVAGIQFRHLAGLLLAVAMVTMAWGHQEQTAEAATIGLPIPPPLGTQWRVIAGYNTVTHHTVDPYALDIARTDAETGGTPLLSPMLGTVGYVSDTCVSVRDNRVNILMCHVFANAGLERGQTVRPGQRLATIAPDGEAENNGIAHVHYQLNARTSGRSAGNGEPLPFAGEFALEGRSLPAIADSNGYYLEKFTSSNDASLALTNVKAGVNLTVDPGQTVTLNASSSNAGEFYWEQYEGVTLALQPAGAALTFVAPQEAAVLRFRVMANGPLGVAVDTVRVTVRAVAIGSDAYGQIVAGSIPDRGVGLIVFGGGTGEELLAASGCTQQSAAFFVTVEGRLVGYIPAAQVALVNAEWNAVFPDGLPANTPLIGRCA